MNCSLLAGGNTLKIDIIGSVASGKTTLAKEISKKYQIPCYEKDNVVWERTPNGDKKRSPEERDRIFDEIIKRDHWIVEGSPRKVLQESFSCSDYIILLDVNLFIRLFRVFRRWVRQRTGKETYNSKPTFEFLYYNVKWVVEYSTERQKMIELLSAYGEKFQIFHTSKQAMQFIKETFL
jgi:adenylate kinase family enzyme